MNIVKTVTVELTLAELQALLIEKAGLTPDAKVIFKYKDIADDYDRFPNYAIDGVTLVDTVK